MIDKEQAVAVFQDAVDHAGWSGRESVLEAGIDAVLALEAPAVPLELVREELIRSTPDEHAWRAWVDGVIERLRG